MTIKEKIISEYTDRLKSAQSMQLSEYSRCKGDDEKRIKEDEERLANFIKLVNMLGEED